MNRSCTMIGWMQEIKNADTQVKDFEYIELDDISNSNISKSVPNGQEVYTLRMPAK